MNTSISLSNLLTTLLPASCDLRIDAFELDASAPHVILPLTSPQRS